MGLSGDLLHVRAGIAGVLPGDPESPPPGCWPGSEDQAQHWFTGTLLIHALSLSCTMSSFPIPLLTSSAGIAGTPDPASAPNQPSLTRANVHFALHLPLRALLVLFFFLMWTIF